MQPNDYDLKPTRKHRRKNHFMIIAALAIVALAIVVVLQQIKIRSETAAEESARATVDRVAKIMVLPEEEPIISEVANAAELSAQPFFQNVQDGDQVLVFVETAKIVLYRPATHQIVNAGPIVDDTLSTGED